MTTIGFFALAVFGLGALSIATDADIIAIPGLGQAPGAVGMIIAVAVFAGILWAAVRIKHPRFRSVWAISITTALAHLLGVGLVVAITSGEFVTALAVMGGLITGGSSLVILVVAAVTSWAGVALRRTKAKHPRWPWERDDPNDA
jgi:small-conductance mechanosensitive channel